MAGADRVLINALRSLTRPPNRHSYQRFALAVREQTFRSEARRRELRNCLRRRLPDVLGLLSSSSSSEGGRLGRSSQGHYQWLVAILTMTGVRMTMKMVGKMHSIIGTVSLAGRA